MASIHRKTNGTFEIRFFVAEDRRSFYPGKNATKKNAEAIGLKLDRLAFAATHGETPPPSVAEWLLALPDRQHDKLASWGLVQRRTRPSDIKKELLGDWLDAYIKRGSRKDSTNDQLEDVARNLKTHFGAEKPISEITEADAEDFRIWLETEGCEVAEGAASCGLAKNTVRRRIGRAREFFNLAVKRKIIEVNPFAQEAVTVGANPERQFFVPADWIERCIKVCNCEDWRIMLAFARYAGMRSHETRMQRWEDIDIPNCKMIIRSNKTPPERVCPIFPELMPHLMRAKEMACEGADLVVTRYTPSVGINETFKKIVKRAGLNEWPKLMQNLRATRETELLARYPIKDVTSWIGNSAPVAMKHYAMTMQESFNRAIEEGAGGVSEKTPQNTPHKTAFSGNQQNAAIPAAYEKSPQNANACGPMGASESAKGYRRRDSNPHSLAGTGF